MKREKAKSRCQRLRHTRYCSSDSSCSALVSTNLTDCLGLDTTLLLALCTPNNSSGTHCRNHLAQALGVERCIAKTGANDILWDGPEAG
jgi:hypothetical protein